MAAAAARQVGRTAAYGTISFLSDYGLRDEFVGVCKGVVRCIAPDAAIIDITHDIEPFAVRRASLLLKQAVRYMPVAVHLAIVDPTVGSARRAIALRSSDGSVFVGPDNGLMISAVRARGGLEQARELSNPALRLGEVSRTFHGRDIFAPAAAHLAAGTPIEEFGDAIASGDLVELPGTQFAQHGDHVHCSVDNIDRFGNVALSQEAALVADSLGLRLHDPLVVWLHSSPVSTSFQGHFSEVEPGQPLAFCDSSGSAALAVNQGSFAQEFGVGLGDDVVLAQVGVDPTGCGGSG